MNQSSKQKVLIINTQTKSSYFTKKINAFTTNLDNPSLVAKKISNPQSINNIKIFRDPVNGFKKPPAKKIQGQIKNFTPKGDIGVVSMNQTFILIKEANSKNIKNKKSQGRTNLYSSCRLLEKHNQNSEKYINNNKIASLCKQNYEKINQQNNKKKYQEQQNKFVRRRTKSTQLYLNEVDDLERQVIYENKLYLHLNLQKNINLDFLKLNIVKQLGSGKFSTVYMVKHTKTGFLGALKVIKKETIVKDKLINQIIRQIKIHSFINHPNLIKLYGYFQDKQNLYLLQELGCNGQLYKLLKKKKRFSQKTTSFIIRNLLKAINYLHSNKILHRDIKPQNIMLIHGNIKLCDFGCSVHTINNLRSTFCGSPLYVSPEIVKGQKYNQSIDLWAIGILTYQLFYGYAPFEICRNQQIFKIVTDQIRFPNQIKISAQLKDFLENILKKSPSLRSKCEVLLSHAFIMKYYNIDVCEQLLID